MLSTPVSPHDTHPHAPLASGDDLEAERACRLANLAWHWVVTRAGYRSHLDRLRALEAAGVVADETYFAGLARKRAA